MVMARRGFYLVLSIYLLVPSWAWWYAKEQYTYHYCNDMLAQKVYEKCKGTWGVKNWPNKVKSQWKQVCFNSTRVHLYEL